MQGTYVAQHQTAKQGSSQLEIRYLPHSCLISSAEIAKQAIHRSTRLRPYSTWHYRRRLHERLHQRSSDSSETIACKDKKGGVSASLILRDLVIGGQFLQAGNTRLDLLFAFGPGLGIKSVRLGDAEPPESMPAMAAW